MNRLPVSILLQDQDAGTLRVVGIVFDHRRPPNGRHRVPRKKALSRKFVVAVIGNPHVPGANETNDPLEGFAHNGDSTRNEPVRRLAFSTNTVALRF